MAHAKLVSYKQLVLVDLLFLQEVFLLLLVGFLMDYADKIWQVKSLILVKQNDSNGEVNIAYKT
ncbi:hypothetical protein SY85_21475 [Flavisolibacter tropicus]|uniref:Uncharacterized protein n=1 Tax=Flavisolibacter tropicus TaxID=1492898 RepID=A0A172U0F6_9BACT|nr:hypothetical protein SY85_21475 [Flavisolibacter tropicus]